MYNTNYTGSIWNKINFATTFSVDLKFQTESKFPTDCKMGRADKFSNWMDVEEAIVPYFEVLLQYLPGGTGENNETSVSIAGLSAVCPTR
jgi:hypothetical protein